MKPILIPPPTHRDEKGRPRTKWDDLAKAEPPREPHRAAEPTPMRGLSDDAPLAGMPKFTKRFQ